MSFNKKISSSSYSGLNNKTPAKTNGYVAPYRASEAVGSGRKKVVNDLGTPSQNKTPNKSGLTPIRPTKSPGTGIKLKSGLTPVHPGVSQGLAKSPFSQKPKLKSGLLPMKPSDMQSKQVDEFNCSSVIARRKSGLQPIKPGGTVPCYPSQARKDISTLESKPFTFAAPKHIPKGEKSSDTVPHCASRRKSGLAPVKRFGFGTASDLQSSWKPRSSISNTSTQGSMPRIQVIKPVESTPSLNVITEDTESPGNIHSNLSGFGQLDETADMTVDLWPRMGKRLSSRIPLPRTTLDSAHFTSSEITKTRIPKRVLDFSDVDDKERTHTNILKDGSSKVNVADVPSTNQPSNQADAFDREENKLINRKKEIETAIKKMSSELGEIDEQLRVLQHKRKNQSTRTFENNKECEEESDSPFGHVVSPVSTDPLELLTLAKSKQPENIYRSFRQSCSFLKTPQHSAFLRPRELLRSAQQPEDSPNVSQRLQSQLADLFAQ